MSYESDKYHSTVNYLYGLQKHGIKLGLSNIRSLMKILGEPHRSFRSIHIAGTNGKGSTATALASILKESGYKTGLFTSPHLVSFTERIRIDNERISEDDVIKIASELRDTISKTDLNPTFFEVVTAMAFHYFATNNVEWAVIETGLGGRLDATNVLEPELTIITNISLDHAEFLGDTIPEITSEKAGIIKPGIPLITAARSEDVISQLSEAAWSAGSPIHIYEKNFRGSLRSMTDDSVNIDYSGDQELTDIYIPLSGGYQLYNASTAIRASEILNERGISIPEPCVRNGLRNIVLEGRLESISESPPIILDSAHNPVASQSLVDSLNTLYPDKRIIYVAGVMGDKDIKEILEPLVQTAEMLILTKPQYERAASPERLERIFMDMDNTITGFSRSSLHITSTVKEAIRLAVERCTGDNIIVVTGSFYTTGEVKELFGSQGVLSTLREK